MPFNTSESVQIERDASGRIISLNHLGQPYRAADIDVNVQQLGEAYLHEVAVYYGIDPAWLDSLAKNPSDVVEDAGTELRFGHLDAITGTATVSFQQTHFGLPVWQAGFTVSMLTGPLRATASLSTLHAVIDIPKPDDDA